MIPFVTFLFLCDALPGPATTAVSKRGAVAKTLPVVQFRDSKLTMLLSNCLGGNSKAVMIACLTPASGEEQTAFILSPPRAHIHTPHCSSMLQPLVRKAYGLFDLPWA